MEAGKVLVMTSAVQIVGKERWKGRYPMTILKVIIPKGEMPENCQKCKKHNEWYQNGMFEGMYYFCGILSIPVDEYLGGEYKNSRHPSCPLEEEK
jgi:hypothetical protein